MRADDRPKDPAVHAASLIERAYDDYQDQFMNITKRSGDRFNRRDWPGVYQDALDRLDLYTRMVKHTVNTLRSRLGNHLNEAAVGAGMKTAYTEIIRSRDDVELAETFFNSIVRRVYAIAGVAPHLEFVASEFKIPRIEDRDCPVCGVYAPFSGTDGLIGMFREMLSAYSNELQFSDPAADARRIAGKVEALLLETAGGRLPDAVEMITAVFYRDKAAYIIGRMRIGDRIQPLVVAFLSKPGRGGGGCSAHGRKRHQHPLQFHPVLFPRRRGQPHGADQFSENAHADETNIGNLHLHRVPQTRQVGNSTAS